MADINYGEILYCDIANGIGCRTALFVSGCTHYCKECFNEKTWDFNFGEPFTEDVAYRIIESLKPNHVDGLSLLGGEPMEPTSQAVLCPLLERVKVECPQKTVWIYSGYTWEELADKENSRCQTENTEKILKMIDILVDGKFVLGKKILV